ncbi:unnamed protein product [marine sediment metagenome]|uniref:NodB homology domain-containing protein n=1 Tax=marine sediment metagenome TaxID=412755 RepID=X1DIQ5_9ZZZZ
MDELAKGVIVFTFDDGYENTFNVAYPIMKKCGLVGTVFIITDLVAPNDWRGKKTMSWKQITELYKNGWDIGSHTASHPWLMKISLAEVINELEWSKLALEKHGFKVAGIGYAAGDAGDTEAKKEAVKKYYGWGRTFRSRPIFVDHSTDRYRVPGICILDNQPNFPPGYSLEDAKATVDKAILEKKGLVLAFHRIFKERGSFITAEADFVGLCEYVMLQIRNESLECLTLKDFMEKI